MHAAVVFSNIMVYIRTASRDQHFCVRLGEGRGYAEKSALCALEKMSTIMDGLLASVKGGHVIQLRILARVRPTN